MFILLSNDVVDVIFNIITESFIFVTFSFVLTSQLLFNIIFFGNFKMSREKLDEHSVNELFNNGISDKICINHLLNSSDFISKPVKSKTCTIDENIVQLQYPLY